VIDSINAVIPAINYYLPIGGAKNIEGFINSSTFSDASVKAGAKAILSYLYTTEVEWSDFTAYIIGVEDMVISDSSMSSSDRTNYLAFISILKYSYAFWAYADTLH